MSGRFVPRQFVAGANFFVLQTFKYSGVVLQRGDDFRVPGITERTLRTFHNARLIGCAPGDIRPAPTTVPQTKKTAAAKPPGKANNAGT